MLVVSPEKLPTTTTDGQETKLLTSPKTKHAAELCALLVNDLYGELPSVCSPIQFFNLLLGRLGSRG